jgi:GNAT superfamily N-acetyltransferase
MNTSDLLVEPLYPQEMAANVALAQQVGWPDDEADWRVLHAAAVVLGVRRTGQLIGHGALAPYEPNAGSIAKMVVAPSAQKQGIGAAILDALLAEAERRGLTTLGLVATPLGQPLYESRGFEVAGEVAVFIGTPSALDRAGEPLAPVGDIEAAIAYERRFIACSRAAMLRGRQGEASVSAIARAPDGSVCGFAFAVVKGPYLLVGPVIADTEERARDLIRAVLARNTGPVRIDVPAEQAGLRGWLQSLGVPDKGLRAEMARGGALPWRVPQRFVLASQAWG